MKKIFTLIAVAAMALSANAQNLLTFTQGATASDVTLEDGEFKVNAKSNKSGAAIDANSQYFGTAASYEQITTRWKSGGKGDANVNITITVPSKGTVYIYTRSASSSATDRALVVSQGETELYNKVIKETEATDYETATIEGETKKVFPVVAIPAEAGTLNVTWTTNALNFYGFKFVSEAAGIESVKGVKAAFKGATYNVAGQQVNAAAKGLVIKNGVKVVNK